MPTPFMHMRVAEQLAARSRDADRTTDALPPALGREWPAFYFGHIAPDYQALCGVRRSATHFYRLPPALRDEAVRNLLAQHPQLANAPLLEPDQAAFLAGYLAHLFLDLVWHFDVVMPYFIDSPLISDATQGHLLHLLLLAHLDGEARAALAPAAQAELLAARPRAWAPFAPDAELATWRDYVAAQLAPGAPSRTADIYGARLGMEPGQFAAALADPARVTELFRLLPVEAVRERLEAAVPQSLALVTSYLDGALQARALVVQP